MPVSIPIDAVGALMREVARTEVLPRFRNLSDADIRTKSSAQDLVTEADIEAERVLTAHLPAFLPGSTVVGEEAVYGDPTILNRLDGDAPVWVIDPVDGTANFSAGQTTFAMIVALVSGGQTIAGWILDPLGERLAVAERGSGAWLGGQRVGVSGLGGGPLDRLEGCAYGPRAKVLRGQVGRLWKLGSAAHSYLRLLDGRLAFATYSRLMPWDHAAGVLLWQEAGGVVRLLDGTAYSPMLQRGDLLMTTSEPLWRDMATLLRAGRA